MNAPNLRCRPLFVSGMPILRERRDLNAETPMNLQIENPPRFMAIVPILNRNPASPPREFCNAPSSPLCRRCDSDRSSPNGLASGGQRTLIFIMGGQDFDSERYSKAFVGFEKVLRKIRLPSLALSASFRCCHPQRIYPIRQCRFRGRSVPVDSFQCHLPANK